MEKLYPEFRLPTPLRQLNDALFEEKKIEVWLKEDHLTHPLISGNKYRKLKYNLVKARELNKSKLLSFGGAYSNHIHALAAAGKLFGFETECIIRGDELHPRSSPTLSFAHDHGMQLQFVTRADYRNKDLLANRYDNSWYIIPEGGSNNEALAGCSEMVDELLDQIKPTHICCAAGTGGTAAGILSNIYYQGKIEVFPVLKNGFFIRKEIDKLTDFKDDRISLHTSFHFGGYGKCSNELSLFIENSEYKYNTTLDEVYTGKLVYGVLDLIREDYFEANSVVVIYHSGGLQGKRSAL
jgi:1-aminocyclopropane-1-carboxylate deaminase